MYRPPIAEIPPNHPPRSLQQVSTLATLKSVISWMIEDEALHGLVGLNARTISMFLEYFRGNRSASLIKANRWWQQRDNFSTEDDNNTIQYSCSRSRLGIKKRYSLKSQLGRGKKRSDWVQYLYPKLLEAFERHKKAGVKFSSKLLRELALSVLVAPDSIFTNRSVDPKDNVLLINKITRSWITQFMDTQNIVLLSQRGRLTCSPDNEMQIEMQTAFHLGILQRGFASQEFNENLMKNLDETHFVVNFDNGRTLGFMGDTTVKYS